LEAKINASRTRMEDSANKEYESKTKEVKSIIRNDKIKLIEHLTGKTQDAANIGNIKELYENIKFLSQKSEYKVNR
jgi:hypothetical protein